MGKQGLKWVLKYVLQTTFYKRNSFFSRRNSHIHGQISSPFTAIIYKWGTIEVESFENNNLDRWNKLTSTRSWKLTWKNIWSRYKREANILQKGGSRILWLKLRMKPYSVHNCKVSFVWRKYIRALLLPNRQPIKVLNLLNERKFEISLKIQQIETAYTIQTIICRRGTAKWSKSDL